MLLYTWCAFIRNFIRWLALIRISSAMASVQLVKGGRELCVRGEGNRGVLNFFVNAAVHFTFSSATCLGKSSSSHSKGRLVLKLNLKLATACLPSEEHH